MRRTIADRWRLAWTRLRKQPARSALKLAAFLIVFFSVEEVVFLHFMSVPAPVISLLAHVYQPLLTLQFRTVQPRFTTIVRIEDPKYKENVRQARDHISCLLTRVAEAEPRAIVLDAILEARISYEAEDQKIRNAIRCLTQEKRDGCPKRRPLPIVAVTGVGDDGLLLKTILDPLVFELRGNALFSLALANLDKDKRIVRLRWDIRDSDNNPVFLPTVTRAVIERTLAEREITGALRRAMDATRDSAIQKAGYSDRGNWFYVSYANSPIPRDEHAEAEGWQIESGKLAAPLSEDDRRLLRGRIVVIGAAFEKKLETPVGELFGHEIHANQIDAMLDGRALRPVTEWLQFPTAVLVWLWVFTGSHSSPKWYLSFWHFVRRLGVAFAIFFAANLVLVHFFGYYGDFPALGLAALAHFGVDRIVPQH